MKTLGGAERYSLTLANVLSDSGYDVTFITDMADRDTLIDFCALDLSNVHFKYTGDRYHFNKVKYFSLFRSVLSDKMLERHVGEKCDFFINTSPDSNLCFGNATTSIKLIHFPQLKPRKKSNIFLIYQYIYFHFLKSAISKFDYFWFNSNFTKKYIKKEFREIQDGTVIYPPVSVEDFEPSEKKNIIITIGRIEPYKKYEYMIDTFRKIYDTRNDIKFYILGTFQPEHEDYYAKIMDMVEGYPIFILKDANFSKLKDLLSEAKIYWHARGYMEDLPIYSEHFGISTVEAMASGCVPVVINKGGQKEIVDHGVNGFRWDKTTELLDYTLMLFENPEKLNEMGVNAIEKSKLYGIDEFKKQIIESIKSYKKR